MKKAAKPKKVSWTIIIILIVALLVGICGMVTYNFVFNRRGVQLFKDDSGIWRNDGIQGDE